VSSGRSAPRERIRRFDPKAPSQDMGEFYGIALADPFLVVFNRPAATPSRTDASIVSPLARPAAMALVMESPARDLRRPAQSRAPPVPDRTLIDRVGLPLGSDSRAVALRDVASYACQWVRRGPHERHKALVPCEQLRA
jgi:hypothetical protein